MIIIHWNWGQIFYITVAQPFAGPIFWPDVLTALAGRQAWPKRWTTFLPQRMWGGQMVQGASMHLAMWFLGKTSCMATIISEPRRWVFLERIYLQRFILRFLHFCFPRLVCSMFIAAFAWQDYEEWENGYEVRRFDGSTVRARGLGRKWAGCPARLASVFF